MTNEEITNLFNEIIAEETPIMVKLKDVTKGELIRIGKSVYVKEDYDRTEKKYMVTRWDDHTAYRYVKGSKDVEIDFTF